MKHADHDAHRAFEESALHAGCTGDCADGAACNCSHAKAWRAPRQPRRPEPRTPHLPLWMRVKLEWQADRVHVVLSGIQLVCMLVVFGSLLAMWLR